jgi:nicotinamidase-related amidase
VNPISEPGATTDGGRQAQTNTEAAIRIDINAKPDTEKGGAVVNPTQERPALLVIDMVKDNFDEAKKLPITPLARAIIPTLNLLARLFRGRGWPVVFSTDAFQREDFIFTGRMRPHSLAGTEGAEVVDALERGEGDLWLPKPRFSAFFGTGLEGWLRERGVTLCAVGGVATHFCVLTSVMDAVCHGFKAVLLEDCSAAPSAAVHEQALACYRKNPIYPLLKVASAAQLTAELTG